MVIALLTVIVPVSIQGDGASDGTISITDSRGVTTNLTGPAVHVASFGAFVTNTLVDIGFLEDKAVIFDTYSEYNSSGIPEMENKSADMFIKVSSTNKDAVVQTMLDLVDASVWNLTTDVIFGYGYGSYATMWSELEGYGFNVITFYPNSYDGIVQVVEDIETVMGADHSVSEQMTFVKTYIAETLSDKGIDEDDEFVTAVYASYSGGNLKLGNTGSVTVDFINYAGGVNVAEDANKSSPTYAVDFSAILQLNPEYVLVDGYYSESLEVFSAQIGSDDIECYKLNKSWNSYCPDAMEGLWTVACLFYPDIFDGDVPVEEDMGDNEISITDSRGVTTNLTGAAVHVASFGAFVTNTLVDIGHLDKAVIFDSYSAYDKSGIQEVQNYSADLFITVSSGNKDAVVQTMLDLVDDGIWNKSTDVIFGYGYGSYSPMWSELEEYGFNVISFYPHSYDGIVQVVEDIETVVGGNHTISEQMAFIKTYIADTLSDEELDDSARVKVVYASYSGDVLKLGNTGSVTVDFINYAGGINIAEDANKSSPTYAVDFSAILQLNPDIVLLDGYYSESAEDFSAKIGNDDIQVYKLNKSWNSYCPDAMEGLWTVACLFYPDLFEGDIPVEGATDVNDQGDYTMIIAAIGLCLVLLVAAVLLIRGRKEKND